MDNKNPPLSSFYCFLSTLVLKLCSIKHLLELHAHLHPFFNGEPLDGWQKAEQKQFIFISEAARESIRRRDLRFRGGGLPFPFKSDSHLLMQARTRLHKREAIADDRPGSMLLVFLSLSLQLLTASCCLSAMQAGHNVTGEHRQC